MQIPKKIPRAGEGLLMKSPSDLLSSWKDDEIITNLVAIPNKESDEVRSLSHFKLKPNTVA